MLILGLRTVVNATIQGQKIVKRWITNFQAPSGDVHCANNCVTRLRIMCQKIGVVGIVVDPGVCRDVGSTCLEEETITTFEGGDTMPKSDSGFNLLLCTTLVDNEVCNRRFLPLDVHIVHIERNIVDSV